MRNYCNNWNHVLVEQLIGTNINQKYLPIVKIKYYNVMINLQNFFDQSVKSNLRTYDNMGKIATGQRDDLRLVVC